MTHFPETRDSLIIQVKDPGNREAWEEFVRLYRPVIYRMAVARGLQNADAQDLTQQVLLSVASSIERWERLGEGTKFRHWLRRVARNAIINLVSRRPADQAAGNSSVHEFLERCPAPGGVELRNDLDSLIELEVRRELYLRAAAIVRADVDEATWRAFEMTVVDGMSNVDAAVKLSKSIGTIYAARSRVMKRLRAAVSELEALQ